MFVRILSCLIISLVMFSGCKSHKKTTTYKKKTSTVSTVPKESRTNPSNGDEKQVTVITPPKKNASYTEVVSNYIQNYRDIAMDEMLQAVKELLNQ